MALEISKPRTREDYEDIRWYLYHEKTQVYIDTDGDWIAEIDVPCRYRDPRGGKCRIYGALRPPMCRKAKHADCEMNADDARVRFRTVKEYDAWLQKNRCRETKKQRR
jgi:hypothetical protein